MNASPAVKTLSADTATHKRARPGVRPTASIARSESGSTDRLGTRLDGVPDEERDYAEPDERKAEADDEDCIERPGCQGERRKARNGPIVAPAVSSDDGRRIRSQAPPLASTGRSSRHEEMSGCLSDAVCETTPESPASEPREPRNNGLVIADSAYPAVATSLWCPCGHSVHGCDPNERRRTVVRPSRAPKASGLSPSTTTM